MSGSDFEQKPGTSNRIPSGLDDSLHQGDVGGGELSSEESSRQGTNTENSSLVSIQNNVGNAIVQGALMGDVLGGFGLPLVAELGSSIAGLTTQDASLGSNNAMLRAMRDARIDWSSSSLNNLGREGGGKPMPQEQLQRFNAAFGHDFSHVRLHTDSKAAKAADDLFAHAFALGADIYFGSGEYNPGSAATDRLLAHELTHVLQHDEGRLPNKTGDSGVSNPSDPSEQEAYANEDRILGKLRTVDAGDSGSETGPITGADAHQISATPQTSDTTGTDTESPTTSLEPNADQALESEGSKTYGPAIEAAIANAGPSPIAMRDGGGLKQWLWDSIKGLLFSEGKKEDPFKALREKAKEASKEDDAGLDSEQQRRKMFQEQFGKDERVKRLLHGTAQSQAPDRNIAILRQNFAKHPFVYTMQVTGLEGVLAGNGDCRSLATAFQRLAEEALGITGIEIRGMQTPFLAQGGPTLDPNMVGNLNDGSLWFFQNHWWAEYQGTPIDLLFPERVPDESAWTKAAATGRLVKDGQKTEYEYWKLSDGRIVWGNTTDPVGPNKYTIGKLPAGHQMPGKHETIFRKEASPDSGLAPGHNVLNLIEKSSGTPIPAAVASRMTSALGYDVSGARIHTDGAAAEAAKQLNALAFALGADIYFAEGRFAPGSAQGDELIAHELAHVVQHTEGRLPSASEGLQTSAPGDAAELEAESMARDAVETLSFETSEAAFSQGAESEMGLDNPAAEPATGQGSNAFDAPTIDSTSVSLETAPAMRDAVDAAVGMLPEEIRFSLAGMGVEVDLPQNAEVNKTIALQINTELFNAIQLKTARVSFDEAYEFKGGAVVADVGLGEFISINETSLTVSSSGSVSTSIKGAALHLNSVLATEINLTVGNDGIHGDATVGFDEITLQDGFTLDEGEVQVAAAPDGGISGHGRLLGEVAGIGVFLLEAELADEEVSGNVTVELETMELGSWGKLNSGVFEGEYTTEGTTVSGKVNMSIKDWADAEIDLTYVHPKDGSGEGQAAQAQGGGEGAAEAAAQSAANTDSNGAAQGSSEVEAPESQDESQVTGLEGGEQASEEGGEQGGGTTLALPGPGTWNGTVKLSQNKEITLGEVTVSNGELNFSIEDNVLTKVDYNADVTLPHFSGNAKGTYDIVNDKLRGTGTLTLTESITLESGVVITACSGEMNLEDNEVTQVKGSFEAEVPYEEEPTFRVNADDLVYDVKEESFSGSVTVTTMRDLSFGPEDGTRAVIKAEASAQAQVEDNDVKRINSGIAYEVLDALGPLGSGTLTMEITDEGVNAAGSFTLDTRYGIPSREVGPAYIEPGAQLDIEMAAGKLTKATITSANFSIINPAGEGLGRVFGMAEGSYDFENKEATAMVMAGVVEDWPISAEWGEITFTNGGSVTVSIEKNELDVFEVHVPFDASFNAGPGVKISGQVDGSYDSESKKYSGSVDAKLAENVDITFAAGDKITLVAEETTARAEVAENALDNVTMGLKAQYFDKEGTHLLDGTISDAMYQVKDSKLSFKGELTLMQPIEKQTDDGKWKLVVLEGRSVNVEVTDNNLTKIGGNVDFEIWDSQDKLLYGSIREAEVDTVNWKFSGEMDLKTARDFVHPKDGGDLGTGPEWLFTVKKESGVRGRIDQNSLANLGADLFFDVKREGADFAAGELSGDLDMASDEFTGKGKVTLTNDFKLEPTEKGSKLAGWAFVINQGSSIDVDINKNDLITTTINLDGRVDVEETTYAQANINGSYKIGDPKGYTGSVGVVVTNDIIWNDDGRFQYMLAATSSITAQTEGSKAVAAEGTFLLAAKEQGETKVICTMDTNWTESGGLNASGEVDVENEVLIYANGDWALYLDKDSGGTGTIANDELTQVGGTINLRLDRAGEPLSQARSVQTTWSLRAPMRRWMPRERSPYSTRSTSGQKATGVLFSPRPTVKLKFHKATLIISMAG